MHVYHDSNQNIVHLLRSTSFLEKNDLEHLGKKLAFFNTKITKSDYIWNTKNRTKKII